MYKTFYNRNNAHNVVTAHDIDAFRWFDNNTPKNAKFLINANGGNGLVFSTDAGGWLEVFTDRSISPPFYDYGSTDTDLNVKLYYRVKENKNDCDAINELANTGFEYYYQGSKHVFDTWLGNSGRFLLSCLRMVTQLFIGLLSVTS